MLALTQKYRKPHLLCHDSFFIHFKFVLDAILFLDTSRDTWVPGERGEEKAKANKYIKICTGSLVIDPTN